MKNLLFLLVFIVCLPFAAVGAVAAVVAAGLRGGYLTTESFLRWLTK